MNADWSSLVSLLQLTVYSVGSGRFKIVQKTFKDRRTEKLVNIGAQKEKNPSPAARQRGERTAALHTQQSGYIGCIEIEAVRTHKRLKARLVSQAQVQSIPGDR